MTGLVGAPFGFSAQLCRSQSIHRTVANTGGASKRTAVGALMFCSSALSVRRQPHRLHTETSADPPSRVHRTLPLVSRSLVLPVAELTRLPTRSLLLQEERDPSISHGVPPDRDTCCPGRSARRCLRVRWVRSHSSSSSALTSPLSLCRLLCWQDNAKRDRARLKEGYHEDSEDHAFEDLTDVQNKGSSCATSPSCLTFADRSTRAEFRYSL